MSINTDPLFYLVTETKTALHRIEGQPIFKPLDRDKRHLRVMPLEEASLVSKNCLWVLGVETTLENYDESKPPVKH